MINQYYGLKLQELCRAKEIKTIDIIKNTGVPKTSLTRFFNGEGYLTLDQLDTVLEYIHVELSEYDYYLNAFKHGFYEMCFGKIEQAAMANDSQGLQEIQEQCDAAGEHFLALCAKSHFTQLTEKDIFELSDFIFGIEIFSFYELVILSDTIRYFSPAMIKSVVQDLKHHHKILANRSRYRRIICQIACRGATACVQQESQKEALECLTLAENYCHERDSYSRLIYRFAKGYYDIYYGQGGERREGLETMRKVIAIFDWEGSKNLARRYQKFYDKYITNHEFPLWLSDLLKKGSN